MHAALHVAMITTVIYVAFGNAKFIPLTPACLLLPSWSAPQYVPMDTVRAALGKVPGL